MYQYSCVIVGARGVRVGESVAVMRAGFVDPCAPIRLCIHDDEYTSPAPYGHIC